MKKTHIIIFTRVERWEVTNAALLTLETAEAVDTTVAKRLFNNALSKWAFTTELGKEAWNNSAKDFNIGDFTDWDTNQELAGILKEYGIISVKVDTFSLDSSYGYDDVLIQEPTMEAHN